MKVAFITPPYSIQERYGTKMKIKKGFLPPLGLGYIASCLDQDNHIIKILDLPVLDLTLEDIKKEMQDFNPDLIAMAAITPTMDKALRIAEELKQVLPNTKIIFGGPHPSLFPESLMKEHSVIDAIAIGEAEYTFKELANELENKNPNLAKVKGLCIRTNDHIRRTEPRPIISDLNELPIPTRKYFDMEKYIPLPNQYKVLPVTNMITGRGCPYAQCTFCFEAGEMKPAFRRISVDRAIEEVKYLVDDYGIREISFWDDVFFVGEKWITDFCNKLKQEKLDIKWSALGFVNYMTYPILKAAADAGCWNIFYGLESGNPQVLKNIKKSHDMNHARKVLNWTHELGIESRGSFIFGLPGENPEIAEETINFAIELDLDYAQFLLNTPYPGTEMWNNGSQYGTFTTDFGEYSVFNPVYIPKGYKNAAELKKVQKHAYRKFYLRPKYILKHLKRIRSLEDVKKYASGVKFILGMGV